MPLVQNLNHSEFLESSKTRLAMALDAMEPGGRLFHHSIDLCIGHPHLLVPRSTDRDGVQLLNRFPRSPKEDDS